MHAYHQCLFNVGSAAGTCSEADERWQLIAILFLHELQGILYIKHQLPRICDANMYGRIHAHRAATLLRRAQYHGARSCNQGFAGGEGYITISQWRSTKIIEKIFAQHGLQLLFLAKYFRPFLLGHEIVQMRCKFLVIDAINKLSAQPRKMLRKLHFGFNCIGG